MKLTNINRALLNRVNMQHTIESINNRIDDVVERIGEDGVDVVFKLNDAIKENDIDELISNTGLEWINSGLMHAAAIYEAQIPSSIDNLRPGMWEAHGVKDNVFVVDVFSPLETFVRFGDGSMYFVPASTITTASAKNYGGSIQHAIERLVNKNIDESTAQTILSNIASSKYFDDNNLYFIQNNDYISNSYKDAHAESFTLHFE